MLCAAFATSLPARRSHGACTLQTGNYSTSFTSNPFASEFDVSHSTASGWGSGTLAAPYTQGTFPAAPRYDQKGNLRPSNNPVDGNVGVRVLAAETGRVSGTSDGLLPLVYVTDTDGCRVGYWDFIKRSAGGYTGKNAAVGDLYLESAMVDTSTLHVIDDTASCAPGLALAVGPVDAMALSAAEKADVVVVTPKNHLLEGSVDAAALYVASSAKNDDTFTKVDIKSILQDAGVAIHGGSPIALSDVDGDGRPDLLVASSHGTVNELLVFYAQPPPAQLYTFTHYETLVADLGFKPPFADATHAVLGDGGCSDGKVSRGATGVTRADVDGDGIADLLVVSDDEPGVHYFKGVTATTYERRANIPTPGAAGLRKVFAYDYTGEGDVDLLTVRSGWGCQGKPGEVQLLRNDGLGNFSATRASMISPAANADWTASIKSSLDATSAKLHFYQNNYSFLFGKTNARGDYQVWNNYAYSNKFATKAVALSKALTLPNDDVGNIVDVTVTELKKDVPRVGHFSLNLSVSADDGANWESLTGSELTGTPHPMQHVGRTLRWRAQFTGSEGSYDTGPDASLFAPGADGSSTLSGLGLRYRYANPQNFSLSRVGYGAVGNTEYIYSASFDTPTMAGHLDALSLGATTAGSAVGLQNLAGGRSWDAGKVLSGRAPATRNLFAALRVTATPLRFGEMRSYPQRRVPLSSAALGESSHGATLQAQLKLTNHAALTQLSLLRAGANPNGTTLLRDPGHASPAFVGMPSEDPTVMGAGYADFVAEQKQRTPTVLLAANDGMLHAFDAATGTETWAMVPSNLLGRLRDQLGRDSNGRAAYVHQTLLEGPTTVADVSSKAGGWRSVAFFGQGLGSGSDGASYVSAVDVTSPSNPLPLWEMTEGIEGGTQNCDPNPCAQQSCSVTDAVTVSAAQQNVLFRGEMDVGGHRDPTDGLFYALLEAEHMDVATQGTDPRGVDWRVMENETSGAGATARGRSYITPTSTAKSCVGTTLSTLLSCPSATFPLAVNPTGGGRYVPMFLVYYKDSPPSLAYTIDNVLGGALTFLGTTKNTWQWAYGAAVALDAGAHQITVYMKDAGLMLDAVAVKSDARPIGDAAEETAHTEPTAVTAKVSCSPACLADPSTQEWPSCGVGKERKCCSDASGSGYCQSVAAACSSPPSRAGRTFSAPAVGRIKTSDGDRWAAFFGSGPDAGSAYPNVGRSVYMVDALTGAPMGSWNFTPPPGGGAGVDGAATEPSVISGVRLVDADGDGYVDRLYVGDLAGRLWKINTYAAADLDGQGRMRSPAQYAACVIFDAGDPNGTAKRTWAPIGATPAAAVLTVGYPNVYFGTGGSDAAPTNVAYSFYAVRDTDAIDACMSTPRRANELLAAQNEFSVAEAAGQGQFFADPAVVDNTGVYFTSTTGNPGDINPCAALAGSTKVYGLAVRRFVDASGTSHALGSSLLTGGVRSLGLAGISRTAPTVRNRSAPQVVRQTNTPAQATDVLLQNNAGVVSRVSTLGARSPGTMRLRVTRFRRIMEFMGGGSGQPDQ